MQLAEGNQKNGEGKEKEEMNGVGEQLSACLVRAHRLR